MEAECSISEETFCNGFVLYPEIPDDREYPILILNFDMAGLQKLIPQSSHILLELRDPVENVTLCFAMEPHVTKFHGTHEFEF